MAEPSPDTPRIEPYDDVLFDKVLLMRDFEQNLYDNPGWLLRVLDGTAEVGEATSEARSHLDYLTGAGAEDFQFDDESEKALANNGELKELLDSRSNTRDADEKQVLRDSIRRLRLRLFMQRVLEHQESQDAAGKITPIGTKPTDEVVKAGGKDRNNVA